MRFSTYFPYIIIAVLMFMLITRPTITEYVEVPAKSGQMVIEKPEPIVHYDTIYKDKIVVKENPVNKELLTKYEQATDSLEKLKLYRDAITIRDYKQTFKDKNQEITVSSKVTGTLERQEISYDIPSYQVKYKNPTEGFYVGVGASSSYRYLELPSLEVGAALVNNKKIYSVGVGTDQTIRINVKQKIF